MAELGGSDELYARVREEHRTLRALLEGVEQAFGRGASALVMVVERLEALSGQLHRHFGLEEASDCFAEMVAHAPRVADRAATLLGEHCQLREMLDDLIARTRQGGGSLTRWDEVSASFVEFRARLNDHEQRENELMQEVFTEDIGSKD